MLAVATARVWLIVTAAKRIGAFESCTRKSMQTLKLLTKLDFSFQADHLSKLIEDAFFKVLDAHQ